MGQTDSVQIGRAFSEQLWFINEKGGRGFSPRPPFVSSARLGRSGFLERILVLDRAAVLPLGVDVAVDQFDDRDRRGVRSTDAGLDDPGVAALAAGVALGQ